MHAPGAPLVQGAPHMGGAPLVQGTPSLPPGGNPAVGQPFAQGGGAAPAPAPSQAPSQPMPGTHPAYPQSNLPQHQQYPQNPQYPQHLQPDPHPVHQVQHLEHHLPQRTPSGELNEGHEGQQKHHLRHHHEQAAHHLPAAATKVAGSGLSIKTIVIVVITIVVVAGGGIGAAAYFLTRPHPVITASSSFTVGSTLAGANGTTLHINGQKFSGSSPITFLLDGTPIQGSQTVTSDSNGNFQTNLKITDGWKTGTHTLTARDGSNYSTQQSVTIMIVAPGQAHTPGPNGAPPDDATFQVNVTMQTRFTDGTSYDPAQIVMVSGHPDPTGGTVCRSQDSGAPIVTTSSTFDTSTAFRSTITYSCTGTYKAGKLTYTEAITSELVEYYNTSPVQTCKEISPHGIEQLSGSYTSQGVFSGNATFEEIPTTDFTCSATGAYFYYRPAQGTWSGQVTNLQK